MIIVLWCETDFCISSTLYHVGYSEPLHGYQKAPMRRHVQVRPEAYQFVITDTPNAPPCASKAHKVGAPPKRHKTRTNTRHGHARKTNQRWLQGRSRL